MIRRAVRGARIEEDEVEPAHILLLRRVIDLDFMLRSGFHVSPGDVDAIELAALKAMRDEQAKAPAPQSATPPKWGSIG